MSAGASTSSYDGNAAAVGAVGLFIGYRALDAVLPGSGLLAGACEMALGVEMCECAVGALEVVEVAKNATDAYNSANKRRGR